MGGVGAATGSSALAASGASGFAADLEPVAGAEVFGAGFGVSGLGAGAQLWRTHTKAIRTIRPMAQGGNAVATQLIGEASRRHRSDRGLPLVLAPWLHRVFVNLKRYRLSSIMHSVIATCKLVSTSSRSLESAKALSREL